jgi:hypothetical protein
MVSKSCKKTKRDAKTISFLVIFLVALDVNTIISWSFAWFLSLACFRESYLQFRRVTSADG